MKKHFVTDWGIVLGWPPTDVFFFFFGGHEPRLQWYQLVSGVGECPVL